MSKPVLEVRWDKYLSYDNIEFIEYVSNYRNGVVDQLVHNLISAHKDKTPSLVLFRFSTTRITTTAYLYEYEVILRRLLKICEQVELYELCAKILKYLKSLNSKSKYDRNSVTTNHIIYNG